jgi:hypothetical protein
LPEVALGAARAAMNCGSMRRNWEKSTAEAGKWEPATQRREARMRRRMS